MKQYIGFSPTPEQLKVIDTVINGDAKYITVVSPRQAGKTLLAINLMLYFSINNPMSMICFISPIYAQARKVMEELVDAIQGTDIVDRVNHSNFEIRFRNGSKILFKSADNPDALRGYTFNYLIMDEAAYVSGDAWKRAIAPTVFIKGIKVLFFSTPRGHDWFYEMYQMGLSTDFENYASCRMSYAGNPFVNMDEIESARKALPDAIFRAEYLGEFLEGESMVFQNFADNCYDQWPSATGKIYAGLDLGKTSDYTVCTFMDETGKVVEIYRQNGTSWEIMTNDVLKLVKKWNATLMVETNSIGSVIFEQLEKQWPKTIPFNTSNSSKREIIESLILGFAEATVRIPSIVLSPELHNELSVFEMTYNPKTRSVQYGARTPFHDDMVLSLSIANWNRLQNKQIGQYFVTGKR